MMLTFKFYTMLLHFIATVGIIILVGVITYKLLTFKF